MKYTDKISSDVDAKFPVESGRYHLYFAYNCPWANGCYALLMLKGL